MRVKQRRSTPPRDPYLGFLDDAGLTDLRPRRMFGCWAYYRADRLVWVSAARRAPWDGILVPTERCHHASLARQVEALASHPVLRKWLYLRRRHRGFEAGCSKLAELVAAEDPRIGVCPSQRRALTSPRPRARV